MVQERDMLLQKANRNSWALCIALTLSDPKLPQFLLFVSPFLSSSWVEIETANMVDRSKSQPMHEKLSLKELWPWSRDPFKFWAPVISLEWIHGLAISNFSLKMANYPQMGIVVVA